MNELSDYLNNSHNFDSSKLTAEEVEGLGKLLLDPQTGLSIKTDILGKLAHRGDLQAYGFLKSYSEQPDAGLEDIAITALGECSLFLRAEICGDDDSEFVFTGVGKNNNQLRFFFMVLPMDGTSAFADWQKSIIANEFCYRARDLQCDIETIEHSEKFTSCTVLIPVNVAVAELIDPIIENCNQLGNFVDTGYYCGSWIPDAKEIEDILAIMYGEKEPPDDYEYHS